MNTHSLATRRRWHLIVLALIIAFAAALRSFSLSSEGFWKDELCTLSCSQGWWLAFDKPPLNQIIPNQITPQLPTMTRLSAARPFDDIIPNLARDEAHPPLYFLLLRLWENLLGDSESAVRSLNVVFSLLAIPLLFLAARDSIGAIPALWACLLMAVAEPQIQFAQEARNYMPVVPFSLIAIFAMQRLARLPSVISGVMLGFSTLAMMLTHYFAAGVCLCLAIYAMTSLRKRARWIALCSFASASAVFLLAWGPFLHQQLPNFSGNYAWIIDHNPGRIGRIFVTFLNLPWRLIADMPTQPWLRFLVAAVGALFYLSAILIFVRRPQLRLWVLWLSCSIGIVVAVDLLRSTAQLGLVRYTLFATPALYVLIAAAIPRGPWRWAPPALAVIAAMLSLRSAFVPGWKTDLQPAVQVAGNSLQPDDGLVIIGSDPINDGVLFAAFQHYLPKMPVSAVLTRSPDKPTLDRLRKCPKVLVVWADRSIALPRFHVEQIQTVPSLADFAIGSFVQ